MHVEFTISQATEGLVVKNLFDLKYECIYNVQFFWAEVPSSLISCDDELYLKYSKFSNSSVYF